MSMREIGRKTSAAARALVFTGACCCAPVYAAGPDLGRELSEEQIAMLPKTIYPDGTGLPEGSGSVRRGESIYRELCLGCHGPNGRGATADELAGGTNALDHEWPDKNIGTYWPFATTLFDFVRRSMPMQAPGSLADDDVYAVAAYLLYLNGIVGPETVMNAESLAQVEMPNRDGFIWIDVAPAGRP